MSDSMLLLSNFTAGELSPALYGRADLAKYFNGCRTLENMMVMPHGGAFKRPGTSYIAETLGRDHVTNGGFTADESWTKGTGWTISGGTANGAAGSESDIYQDPEDLVEGEVYEVIFTISERTAGSITPKIGGTSGTAQTSNDTHSERITCGSTTIIALEKSADFDGKIDNVSVRQVAPATRLESFEFSTVQAYILAFTDQSLRIYKDGGLIVDGDDAYEVSTPYLTADLTGLQFTQSADILYIAHPGYAPYKLTRTGHTSWTLTKIPFTTGPFLDENEGDITLTPSYPAWVSDTGGGSYAIDDCATYGGSCYRNKTGTNTDTAPDSDSTNWEVITSGFQGANLILTASDDLFEEGHLGALWQISHNRDDSALNDSFSSVTESASIKCKGGWEFITHGTWTGTMSVMRSDDGGTTWQTYRTYTSADDNNISTSGDETGDDVLFKVAMTSHSSGTCNFDFLAHDYLNKARVEITEVASATSVICTVHSSVAKLEATKRWNEGAWSDYRGFPACVEFYEDRLHWAGSPANPQTVWASKAGDYENMLTGTYDDDAYTYTIAARGVNAIKWLVPQNELLIGTKGAEWKMGARNDDPIGPANIDTKRQSTYGSSDIQALLVNDACLFVQRAGTKVRELAYSWEADRYVAPDLTLLAEHITSGGIVDIAHQQEPITVLWCIRADGVLLGMTYERTQDVVAWHRHLTADGDDEFESVAVIPGSDEDEIWVSVKRIIDGEVRKYVERFDPQNWGDDVTDCFFVDSGLTADAGDPVVITAATAADPVVITAAAHGFSNGHKILILSIAGMTELNEHVYIVADKTDDTFELTDEDGNDIDGTEFTAYVSGGTAQRVAKVYSGLDHLEGRTVSVLADGMVQPDCVVESGSITISDWANKVHAGLGYTAKLVSMNLESGSAAGTSQGRTKRVYEVIARFKDTLSCKIGTDETKLEEIVFRRDSDPMDTAIDPVTMDKRISGFPGDWGMEAIITIINDQPLPMTVLGLMPKVEISDG